jgi:ubiquinone biosynthesis protein UbiJ
VRVVDPPNRPLLALLLGGVLRARVASRRGRARARNIHGTVAITAGGMTTAVRFDPSGITIGDAVARANARVDGELPALLDMVAGGRVARPVVTGKIKVHGNLVLLLRVLSLLRPESR